MPKTQQTVDFLKQQRQQGPDYYKYLSDDVLYRTVYKENPNSIPQQAQWQELSYKAPATTSISRVEKNKDLGFFANLSDWWVDDNSYDWMKSAYNRSLTGTVEQLVSGESRYNVDESDFSILQDIGATVFSFMMPLDFITMGTGGFFGGKIANQAIKKGLFMEASKKAAIKSAMTKGKKRVADSAAKKVSEQLREKSVDRAFRKEAADLAREKAMASYNPYGDTKVMDILSGTQKALLGGLQQAPALALYEGAIMGVQEEINGGNFIDGAAYGVFHGGLIGGLTGVIGGGMGAIQSSMLKNAAGTKFADLGMKDYLIKRGALGLPGQAVVESTVFSGEELYQRVRAGEDLNGNEILKTFARNIGLFGVLKAQGLATREGFKRWDEAKKDLNKSARDYAEKQTEALDSIDQTLENEGINSKEIKKAKYQKTAEESANQANVDKIESYEKIVQDYLDDNGNLKNTINQDDGTFLKNLNNKLLNDIAEIETALNDGSILDSNLKIRLDAIKKQKQKLHQQLNQKFSDMDWVDGDSVTIGGLTKRKFRELDDSAIQEYADQLNVKNIKRDKDTNQITNKDDVVDAIFASDAQRRADALPQGDKVTFESISKDPTIKEALNNPDNLPTTKKANVKKVQESTLSDSNKQILTDLILKDRKDSSRSQFKIIEDLMVFAEKQFPGINLAKVPKQNLKNLVRDFVNSKTQKEFGIDGLSKDGALVKLGTIKKNLNNSQYQTRMFGDYMKKLMLGLTKISKDNRLQDILGKDISLIQGPKFEQKLIKGRSELTVPGGASGFKKLVQKIKSFGSNFVSYGKKKMKYEDAALYAEFAGEARLRPGEMGGIKVGDINFDTKLVSLTAPSKLSGSKAIPDKILKKLKTHIKKNNLNENDLLFDVASETEANALFSSIFERLDKDKFKYTPMIVDVYPTKKGYHKYGDTEFFDGKKITGREKKGASLFRRDVIVGEGSLSLEESAKQMRNTIIAAQNYRKAGAAPAAPPKKPKVQKQEKTAELKTKLEIGVEEQQVIADDVLTGTPERRKAFKNLEVNLGTNIKGAYGTIKGHVINIASGKVRPDTIPHEVSHYVVNVLKAFGTKKDKDLIQRGIKMFGVKGEEGLVQKMGEYALNQMKDKSSIGKAKSWIRAFNARVKEVFGLQNADDVAFLLSRRVVKGNIPQNKKVKNYIDRLDTYYQKKSKTKDINQRQIKKLESKAEKAVGKEFFEEMRSALDLPQKGKENKNNTLDGPVNDYVEVLQDVIKLDARKSKDTTFLDEVVSEYGFTLDDASDIAMSLGQKDGNYNNMSRKAKGNFVARLMSVGEKSNLPESSIFHTERLSKENIPSGYKRSVLPVYYVLHKYGGNSGKKIANRLLQFDVVANSIYGGVGAKAIDFIKNELPYGKQKLVWMFDKTRVENMIKHGDDPKKPAVRKLTAAEKRFYRLTKDRNNNEITHKTPDNLIISAEGRAKKVHAKLMNHYWESMRKEVKGVTTKAEFQRFEKEFNEKFVEGYFSRRITKEAMEYLISSKSTKQLETKITETIRRAAEKRASEEGKDGLSKANRVKELIQDDSFVNGVAKDVQNMLAQKHHKIKNTYLMERSPILDEFITIIDPKTNKEKIIRTYETELQSTVEPYVTVMSKYLATIRLFPEYTGIGTKYKISKSAIDNLQTYVKDQTLAAYARDAVHKTIGFGAENPLLAEQHKILSAMAHSSAAIGLSSPTSGLKNLAIGIPRAFASFGFTNTGKALIRSMDKSVWDEARAKGILNYQKTHLELGDAKLGWFSMERLFKFNLMTATENLNRVVSHEAGKMYFQNQLNILHGKKGLFGESGVKNAKRLLKDMFKMTDDDIKFLSSKDVMNHNFKTDKASGRYEYLLRQAGHFSHISAQGGTAVPLLPLWASGAVGKPLTLFQRMAYSTTFDTYLNYYKPVKDGNFAPIARALGMHTLSGAALYGLYRSLFEKEPPKSAGSELDKMTMYLHRSEFLGLFGFLASPYDEGAQTLFQPVIARNAMEGLRQFNNWYAGRDDLGGAINKWTLNSIVAYSQFDDLLFKNAPDYRLQKRVQVWKKQFADEYPTFKKAKVQTGTERTYYYRNLKNALYFKGDDDIINEYFAAYNFIVTELEEVNSSPQWRHKEAVKAIKTSLSAMNPLKISDRSTGRNMSKKKMFLNWLRTSLGESEYKEALKSESQYQAKMRRVEKLIRNKKLWKENSVYASLNLVK
tara:strand:- start:603 stop:7226 length:6624 start_codon:yes stop_codon:yes gene_type:complete